MPSVLMIVETKKINTVKKYTLTWRVKVCVLFQPHNYIKNRSEI